MPFVPGFRLHSPQLPVLRRETQNEYSAKLFAGTRHRLSGLSQPRQCGDEVLRIFVTGGPPVRGGDGMPQRIRTISRSPPALRTTGAGPNSISQGATMPDIEYIRAEIEHMRVQVQRQRGEIRQLQRAGILTASAEALLDRVLNKIDGLCAERDRLKKELPGPVKGRVLGGRRW